MRHEGDRQKRRQIAVNAIVAGNALKKTRGKQLLRPANLPASVCVCDSLRVCECVQRERASVAVLLFVATVVAAQLLTATL